MVGSLREKPLRERKVPQVRVLTLLLTGSVKMSLSQSLNLANSKKSWIWMTPQVSSSSKNLRVGSHQSNQEPNSIRLFCDYRIQSPRFNEQSKVKATRLPVQCSSYYHTALFRNTNP